MKVTRFDRLGDVRLAATGHHLPERSVSTKELFAGSPVQVEELERLTGIRRRHVARPDEATSDLAIAAARPLIERGPIDRLFVATMSPDYPSPATAPLVQHGLGLPSIPSADLVATCAGFVYGLDAAARAVLTGDQGVLVVAAETRSRVLAAAAPGVRCLFGDGAAAALVTRGGGGLRLLATALGADGSGHAAVRIPAGGSRMPASQQTIDAALHTLQMEDGPMVFFKAVEGFVDIGVHFAKALGFAWGDIDLVIPHQANLRILERVTRLLRLRPEQVFYNVETVGNVGGASVGIALDQAWSSGAIRPGGRLVLLTAGAGFTAGAVLLEAPHGS